MNDALFALLFFLPAGVANMTPIFVSRMPLLHYWKTPLDFGQSFRGRRIFGNNKTIRGLVFGTIAGAMTGILLYPIFFPTQDYGLFMQAWVCMSAGALLGDAIESFFKRQKDIPSGISWFPFDQTDYIIGGLLLAAPLGVLSWPIVAWVFIWYFGLHLSASYIGFRLGLKDQPI